ncbi:MAG: cytochrome c [Prosthecobacter sp.]|uniref:c-type cytochrome n=1 Tax=Prosthecobacter sp. TaxID=1965333 RepID=UPI002623D022|nr:cytochrome c [Prosthecobacter sp.]MCF7788917.1 cytochrome c [Prosthecobacter sp.]
MKFRLLLALLPLATATLAADKPAKPKVAEAPAAPSPWSDFVEKDFPFFSSVLDAREVGEGFPKDNLTPRGIVLNLGHNLWACFDTDLLRIACIWEGEAGKPPVSADALAPGSYHVAGQKTKDGQDYLPKPIGKVWLANGIYPGWQVGEKPSFVDPREPTPSPEEVGRGSLSNSHFKSILIAKDGSVSLHYNVGDVEITERVLVLKTDAAVSVERHISVAPHREPLTLMIGTDAPPRGGEITAFGRTSFASDVKDQSTTISSERDCLYIVLSPTKHPLEFIAGTRNKALKTLSAEPNGVMEWSDVITTTATLSTKPDAYVNDEIPLPLENPWKRNVRLADVAFLNDQGDAAGVTFDGDVWLISGLKGDLEKVTWKRFASGLHEPMSIVVRRAAGDGRSKMGDRADKTSPSAISHLPSAEILVFDRNGIWKLVDTNGDKECDRYEMFCNLFAQTAETREFPNSMKLGPKGELYISKGGQEGTTYGKHNGTVIKVAADGKSMEVIGYGLRQPFIGVNPKTGLVTASDQQGNYVPSTPLHIISDHHFYGHLPTIAPKEKYPETITEPLTWLPHPVNPSGVTQTWLLDAKMGPVNGELIHIGYNRPELFRVLMNSHFEKPQAAVVSFNRNFDFPTLNAVVNPADGQLYVVGFQVWGTVVKKISGLARVRYTNKPRVLLKEVTPTDKGLLLRFNAKLDEKLATDPDSFNGERWNYKRTFEYGSPHLKLDGSSGQEWMTASSAYLSKDGMSVLVGFPDMKAGVHQMRIGWGLKSVDGDKAENTAYFSPWELMTFDAKKEGFDENLKVDLTPRKAAAVATVKATAEEGERLYQMYGCMACHSTDGTLVGKVGPSWKGLYGSEREIAKGQKGKFKADEAYLRESITAPSAKVVKGFEKFDTGMPIYSGILNDGQIESLILYIKSLK